MGEIRGSDSSNSYSIVYLIRRTNMHGEKNTCYKDSVLDVSTEAAEPNFPRGLSIIFSVKINKEVIFKNSNFVQVFMQILQNFHH